MSTRRKVRLSFYRSGGDAHKAMNAHTLFYPWLVPAFLVLQGFTYLFIQAAFSYAPIEYHIVWRMPLLFGLDLTGVAQMLALLFAGYALVSLALFVTGPRTDRRSFQIGVALHVFAILLFIGHIVAYDFFNQQIDKMAYALRH